MSSTPLRLTRWQVRTLMALCVGYAGYYLCRSNLSVATPLLLEDASLHLDKEKLGWVVSVSIWAYALGKLVNGYFVDTLGGRRLFLFGMVGSIACTLLFGAGAGLVFFILVWSANRLIQSIGWMSLVKVATQWFSFHSYGRVMAMLSLSFLFGDALVRWVLGLGVKLGLGWRGLFLSSAAGLGLVLLGCAAVLRERPEEGQTGPAQPEENPQNLVSAEQAGSFWHLIRPLLVSSAFWTVSFMSFAMTLVRETFNTWLPQVLKEVAGMNTGDAGQWSSIFPLIGGFSVLLAGHFSDRFETRRGAMMGVCSLALALFLGGLGGLASHASRPVVLTLVSGVALFLMGPYSLLGGAMAMDLGGKKACATASGLVDSAGYLGGALSGVAVGALAERLGGWGPAFGSLVAVALLNALAGMIYWKNHERVAP